MDSSRLFVANFTNSVTNQELEDLFTTYGGVKKVKILEGKGTGFVDMSSQSEAEKAKKALNGTVFKGRPLKVIK